MFSLSAPASGSAESTAIHNQCIASAILVQKCHPGASIMCLLWMMGLVMNPDQAWALGAMAGHCRLRAFITYDGRAFHGVQRNRDAEGKDLRTILTTLEDSLWPRLGRQVTFRVAGRTDAGVSARGQAVSFDLKVFPTALPDAAVESTMEEGDSSLVVDVKGAPVAVSDLAGVLNACLPEDLKIREIAPVSRTFDVVRDCCFKCYRYSLPCPADQDYEPLLRCLVSHAARAESKRNAANVYEKSGTATAPGLRPRRRKKQNFPPLDNLVAMQAAAKMFEGVHDFRNFQAKGADQMSSVRTIFRCAVEPRPRVGTDGNREDSGNEKHGNEGFDIVVEGDGFLKHQVRIVAGTLMMVGMSLAPPVSVLAALDSPATAPASPTAGQKGSCRGFTGPTLPAHRLCLEHVEYDTAHPNKGQWPGPGPGPGPG